MALSPRQTKHSIWYPFSRPSDGKTWNLHCAFSRYFNLFNLKLAEWLSAVSVYFLYYPILDITYIFHLRVFVFAYMINHISLIKFKRARSDRILIFQVMHDVNYDYLMSQSLIRFISIFLSLKARMVLSRLRRLILVFFYTFILTNYLKHPVLRNVSNYCGLFKKTPFLWLIQFKEKIFKLIKKMLNVKG